MRVVVLGGTGFVGRAVVEELQAHGDEALVVHRGEHEVETVASPPHLHASRSDLARFRGTIRDFRPDAFLDVPAGTREEAEAVIRAIPQDFRFVVLSSMDVYRAYGSLLAGTATDAGPLDESAPVRTQRYIHRGQGYQFEQYEKLDVEDACLSVGATVLRLPMIYGEHDPQRREKFILRRCRAGRPKIPMGPGTLLWSRGYVRDIAAGIRLAIESERASGEIFNLCEATTAPIRLWAGQIVTAAGAHTELVEVPEDLLPEDMRITRSVSQHLLFDSSKAREILGWSETDPVIAVQRSVRWHLEHPPPTDEDFAADDRALAAPRA
jgi:nucleoside-diphosphate-sugar epimerase